MTTSAAQLILSGARLENTTGPALIADYLRTDQSVVLNSDFTATGVGGLGTLRLVGAHIGGQLNFEKGRLENAAGPALISGARVVDDMLLHDEFTAVGADVRGMIRLADTRIGGTLLFAAGSLRSTDLPPETLVTLDGATYTGIPKPGSHRHWLWLIREHTPDYATQPYQQLAAVYRAAGQDREVRDILMAQRRHQIERRAITGSDRIGPKSPSGPSASATNPGAPSFCRSQYFLSP
ncbi:hypothetical protein AB0F81_42500 [Actinoplanes sp. NPDC024001]|uniref:hypothetical protein n=1 Tax=Actinoplanes sp. NPDC024001 TaxID=3154598 RepID=UPI0033E0ACC1